MPSRGAHLGVLNPPTYGGVDDKRLVGASLRSLAQDEAEVCVTYKLRERW